MMFLPILRNKQCNCICQLQSTININTFPSLIYNIFNSLLLQLQTSIILFIDNILHDRNIAIQAHIWSAQRLVVRNEYAVLYHIFMLENCNFAFQLQEKNNNYLLFKTQAQNNNFSVTEAISSKTTNSQKRKLPVVQSALHTIKMRSKK